MKKKLLGLFTLLSLWLSFVLAQNVIMPDSAKIEVKGTIKEWEITIIEWQATNMTITMMKNGSKMSTYTWEITMSIVEEDWTILDPNKYVLPNRWMYEFKSENLWSMEFQRWLEIKKAWTFYVEVSDFNDTEDKVLWKQKVVVIKWNTWVGEHHIDILSPEQDSLLTSEKVEIFADVEWLPNSTVSVYIDEMLVSETSSDSVGMINYTIPSISQWKHTLRLECHDIEWKILWSSDKVMFTYMPQNLEWFRGITVQPENGLKVLDLIDVTVNTDEMVESVKMNLSDRSENDSIIFNKEWNWVFTQKIYLMAPWEISMDVIVSADNNTTSKTYKDVKRIYVWWAPEIGEIMTDIDDNLQTARISWEITGGVVSWYFINYWIDGNSAFSWQEWTDKEFFIFRNVPYDKEISMNITPYREGQKKHGTASKTVQFIISKPWSWDSVNIWDMMPNTPKCTVQNISLRTTKIWDSYYLMWDKIDNVSKYIVYSSEDESWKNKTKVYETSDTSYEYPFDHTAESDQFLYFWIVWVCDDWEELELSWATKVQVWPAENFFLLLCLTLLIYFWIKMFKETEI